MTNVEFASFVRADTAYNTTRDGTASFIDDNGEHWFLDGAVGSFLTADGLVTDSDVRRGMFNRYPDLKQATRLPILTESLGRLEKIYGKDNAWKRGRDFDEDSKSPLARYVRARYLGKFISICDDIVLELAIEGAQLR